MPRKLPRGLFLDGGGQVGWTVMDYHSDFPVVAHDTFALPGGRRGVWGHRFVYLDGALQELVDEWRPDAIGFESPWQPTGNRGGTADPMAARFLACVAGKFEEIAARNRIIQCSEVATNTARKELTGYGKKMKGETTAQMKARGMAHCVKRGFIPASEHEADAYAVGLVCIGNYLRGR